MQAVRFQGGWVKAVQVCLCSSSVNPKFFQKKVCLQTLKLMGAKCCSSSGKGGPESRELRKGILDGGGEGGRGGREMSCRVLEEKRCFSQRELPSLGEEAGRPTLPHHLDFAPAVPQPGTFLPPQRALRAASAVTHSQRPLPCSS